MITKETSIDKIEVMDNGVIAVREVVRIIENGVQLSASYLRHNVHPGMDYSSENEKVRAICQVVHTPEVIAASQE